MINLILAIPENLLYRQETFSNTSVHAFFHTKVTEKVMIARSLRLSPLTHDVARNRYWGAPKETEVLRRANAMEVMGDGVSRRPFVEQVFRATTLCTTSRFTDLAAT